MTSEPECHETFWDNGQLRCRAFYLNGRFHRTDGPACESWGPGGRLEDRQFYVNGKYHRTDGPAREWWGSEGWGRSSAFFVVNGKWMAEEAFRAWQERQQRQRELRALVFALEHKFPAEAPEREFLRRILPAHMAGGSGHVN